MIVRKRLFILILILTVVSFSIAAITIGVLYNAAFEQAKERLVNIAQSRARLIESVAKYDIETTNIIRSQIPDFTPFDATLGQIIEAHNHFEGFGKTGEFTLAKRENNNIQFLLRHRHADVVHPDDISFESKLAAPMRMALSGKSGTIVGLDYRGEVVLAAYEPVAVVDLGIVAKMDLSEVRAPFVRAGIISSLIALVLVFLGAFLFFRITNPVIDALVKSEARFRWLYESKMINILLWDKDSNITDANDAFLSMIGYSRKDLFAGKLNWRNITPEGYEDVDNRALEEISSTGLISPYEKEYLRKDGHRIPVLVGGATLPGSELNGVAFVINLTERRKLEKERKQLEVHLRQQQKMESMGTLAGGVAHEINNPINGIMNYARLIVDRIDNQEKIKEYSEEIVLETERVARIVKNLLTFARQEKESHSNAQINDIISDTTSLISTIFRHDQIELAFEIPENLPSIRCRSHQIQQVIMNLLTNARDALNERYPEYDENKKLFIKAGVKESDQGRVLRLTVEDYGSGIPDHLRDRVFDPFFTTKDRTKGTGLGLAISYGIIEEHGGKMFMESEPEKFTRFHIEFKVSEDDS